MKVLFLSRTTLYSQPGGDTVQVDQTADFLRELGIEVHIHTSNNKYKGEYALLHAFNLGRPAEILPYLGSGKPLVISSIYIDYSAYDQKRSDLFRWLHRLGGSSATEYLKTMGRYFSGSDRFSGWKYFLNGHGGSIRKILQQRPVLICASHQEANLLKKDFGKLIKHTEVIPLGIEHLPKRTSFNQIRKGVVCAARIEGIKNQRTLIEALNNTDFELKIVGRPAANQSEYYHWCQKTAAENISFEGELKHTDLTALLEKTKVHVLPSFYETTGLSTLEALYCGCQAVVSDHPIQKEIFGDHVEYCSPSDPSSIKAAIEKAAARQDDHVEWVRENFSWKTAAVKIADIYRQQLNSK